MKKVAVIVASRANYGRIKSVLLAIKEHPALELQLVVAASALLERFGNAIEVIKSDGFEVTAKAYCIVEGENPTTMAKSTGLAIQELSTIFDNIKPDIVLSVADRFETMATAIAASYMNIPLAHTQGGEVSGNIDEGVRHAITKLAHIHFPATELSKERIIKMGENPEMVFNAGCPSIDVVANQTLEITPEIFDRYGGTGHPIDLQKPYLLVIQHPVTTEYGSGLFQIEQTLSAVHKTGLQAVWLWPNVDAGSDDVSKGLRVFREKHPDSKIHFYRNFRVEDFNIIMNNAACVIGNSSSPLREGAFLGVPAVNVGTRQRNRERALNIIDATYDEQKIYQAIMSQLAHGKYESNPMFGVGNTGREIANILANTTPSIIKTLQY